ncbi:hypothetical protein SPX_43540 [Sporomusa paucivorans]
MDAKLGVAISGCPSPKLNTLKLMAAMIKDSPYNSMSGPPIKPVKPYTVLSCASCQQSGGTLQKVDNEYYCRKCVRVQKGDFNGR